MADESCCTAPALASEADILARVIEAVREMGVVGEDRLVKLIYLAVTSRLLDQPVSLAVKGPSASGKSFTTRQVLRLFPDSAYVALTAMSERALAYWDEGLKHRVLVIFEEAGIQGEVGSYLVRSLLTEGRIDYTTVDRSTGQLQARRITREGPTGLILTTTRITVHAENETRLLSVPANDSPQQTRNIMLARASRGGAEPNLAEWQGLQDWLVQGERRVVTPFATVLAEMIPAVGIRLRRDFDLLLNLVRAHALLHRASREQDGDGQVLATLRDYEAIRLLVVDLIAEGLEAGVPPTVREAVLAVRDIVAGKLCKTASVRELSDRLAVDKSAASRRASRAIAAGYLSNEAQNPGRPAALVLADPLPDDVEVLPSREALAAVMEGRCTVAGISVGRGEEETHAVAETTAREVQS